MKKAKETKEVTTRTSTKQKFTESFCSVKGYETVNGVKKPSMIPVPELLAIVGTAKRLGKNIQINTSGVDDGGQVDFVFVDAPPAVPFDLQY
jgi:hypothetical protein